MPHLYHVPRSTRIINYWKALPRYLMKTYPEQTLCYSTFGVATVFLAIYKIQKYSEFMTPEGAKPWYRGYYDVVRPNDPIAINWRKPEEYPAPYLSPNGDYAT